MDDMTLSHLTVGAPPLEMIDAAAAAGFRSVGLRLCGRRYQDAFPVDVIGAPRMIGAIRSRLEERGVRLASVNAFQFYPDVDWERLAPVVDTAAALHAPSIIVNGFDAPQRFDALFARFCEAARAAGIRVALEFLPYSRVRTLGDALRSVRASGCENAGVLIDALHLDRSGGTADEVRRVDPRDIVFAQLCDAKRLERPLPDEELMRQARSSRLELGEGELALFELVDALPAGLEIEYEVIRADLAGHAFEARARAARADVDRFVERHHAHRERALRRH